MLLFFFPFPGGLLRTRRHGKPEATALLLLVESYCFTLNSCCAWQFAPISYFIPSMHNCFPSLARCLHRRWGGTDVATSALAECTPIYRDNPQRLDSCRQRLQSEWSNELSRLVFVLNNPKSTMGELPSSISGAPLVRLIVHKLISSLHASLKRRKARNKSVSSSVSILRSNPRHLCLLILPIAMQLKQRVSLLGLDNISTSQTATRHLGQNATDAARHFCLSHEGLKMEPYYSECVVAISQGLALESEVSDDELPDLRLM